MKTSILLYLKNSIKSYTSNHSLKKEEAIEILKLITQLIINGELSIKDVKNISISIGELMSYDLIWRDCNFLLLLHILIVSIVNGLVQHINKSLKNVKKVSTFSLYLTLYTFIFESKSINKFNCLVIFEAILEGLIFMKQSILNEFSQIDLSNYHFNQYIEL